MEPLNKDEITEAMAGMPEFNHDVIERLAGVPPLVHVDD